MVAIPYPRKQFQSFKIYLLFVKSSSRLGGGGRLGEEKCIPKRLKRHSDTTKGKIGGSRYKRKDPTMSEGPSQGSPAAAGKRKVEWSSPKAAAQKTVEKKGIRVIKAHAYSTHSRLRNQLLEITALAQLQFLNSSMGNQA